MLTDLAHQELSRISPGRPSALAIGVFDGVHLGHQYLIGQLREHAEARGLASVVLTFHPAPATDTVCSRAQLRWTRAPRPATSPSSDDCWFWRSTISEPPWSRSTMLWVAEPR